jgi:hypothetical protein
MPGYLTAIKTLIDADAWLGKIVETLGPDPGKSPLENQMVVLATKVRDYFRFTYDAAAVNEHFPPTRPVQIDNQPGSGLSKYAVTGALGPDLPAAANILAVNQRWISDTMHKGSPRRAWQDAGTTTFVTAPLSANMVKSILVSLNTPDGQIYPLVTGEDQGPSEQLVKELKKPYFALMLGHLTSIATHVIVNPFLNQWAWTHTTATRQQFSVQVDAMLAKAYFHRTDLHSGPSWSDYLHADFWPHNDPTMDFIAETYAQAFQSTYGSIPKETLCALPAEKDLIKQFPKLEQVLQDNPGLRDEFTKYVGHDDITAHDNLSKNLEKNWPQPAGHLAKAALDGIDGLSAILDRYQCLAARPERDFFADGVRNTRNWALDAGYDHGPIYVSLFMTLLVTLGAVNPIEFVNKSGLGVVFSVWDNTVNFGGDDQVKADNQKAWIDAGLANDRIWFDFIDDAYGACAIPCWLYNALLSGIKIPKWLPGIRPLAEYLGLTDGFFGQGSDAIDPWYVGPFVFVNDFLGPLFLFPYVLQGWVAKWYREGLNGWLKWIFLLGVNIGFDALEELWLSRGTQPFHGIFSAKERGANGDEIGLKIWYLRLWMTSFYALSAVSVFGLKAGDKPRTSEDSLGAGYYLLSLVSTSVFIGYFIWGRSAFEREMVETFAGVDWPDTDYSLLESLVDSDIELRNPRLLDGIGDTFKVALFSADQMKQINGKLYYPDAEDQDAQTKWDDRRAADDAVRRKRENHTESDQPYRLKQLLDRATMFAGILSMAFVNYDMADTAHKDDAKTIFQDWNLEFLTVDQWNDLMETRKDKKPGLLKAVEQWWSDVSAQPQKTSSDDVLAQLTAAFGMPSGAAKRAKGKA